MMKRARFHHRSSSPLSAAFSSDDDDLSLSVRLARVWSSPDAGELSSRPSPSSISRIEFMGEEVEESFGASEECPISSCIRQAAAAPEPKKASGRAHTHTYARQ